MYAHTALIIASQGRPKLLSEVLDHWSPLRERGLLVVLSLDNPSSVGPVTDARNLVMVYGAAGLPAQRNRAIEALPADIELVFFFDDDCIAAPDYISEAIDSFEARPDVIGITGQVLADGANGQQIPFSSAVELLEESSGLARTSHLKSVPSLYGCNFAVRRAVLELEKFDEHLPFYAWLEDEDFTRRAARHGTLVQSHSSLCVHMGFKSGGRTSHVRFGYSQVVNPWYLARRKSIPWSRAIYLVGRPFGANLAGLIGSDSANRRRRLRGNLIAVRHILQGNGSPEYIRQLPLD